MTHPVLLGLRRIYILPSRHGIMLAIVLLVMLLGSINYNNSLGYLLTFLIAALAMVSILHTYRNLAGLSISGGKVESVFSGENAGFNISLDNRDHDSRYHLALDHHRSRKSADVCLHGHTDTSHVHAGHMQTIRFSVPTSKRGRMELGKLQLSSVFPLGLFRAWSILNLDLQVTVYPNPGGQYELPDGVPEQHRDAQGKQQGAEDFSGFRDYHPGDSPRHIHWKALARDQGPFIKTFTGDGGGIRQFNWSHVAHLQDIESRLSQLCRWVLEAERLGQRYGLSIPGAQIKPDAGVHHRDQCLEALALFGTNR